MGTWLQGCPKRRKKPESTGFSQKSGGHKKGGPWHQERSRERTLWFRTVCLSRILWETRSHVVNKQTAVLGRTERVQVGGKGALTPSRRVCQARAWQPRASLPTSPSSSSRVTLRQKCSFNTCFQSPRTLYVIPGSPLGPGGPMSPESPFSPEKEKQGPVTQGFS